MKKNLSLYESKDFNLPVLLDGKNNPWFKVSDVCDQLELSNISRALDGVEDNWKAQFTLCNPSFSGKNGEKKKVRPWFVSEPGLYALIFKSKKEEAKNFRRWVFEEVLPNIRKQGYYDMRRESLKPTYKEIASDIFTKHSNKNSALTELERTINMVNKAITGMKSHECKNLYNISPRDYIRKNKPERLDEYDRLQMLIKGEIERGRNILQIKKTIESMGYKI